MLFDCEKINFKKMKVDYMINNQNTACQFAGERTESMTDEDLPFPKITSDEFFFIEFERPKAKKGFITPEAVKNTRASSGENAEKIRRKYGANTEKVLAAITANLFAKAHEIAKKTQLSQRTVEKAIAALKKEGVLQRIGPDKGGHWEVVE